MSTAIMESAGISNILSADKHPIYAIDGVLPSAVVIPSTVKELSEVVSLASDRGAAVTPYGGGTMVSLGNLSRSPGLVVVTTSLDGIIQYEPSDLTITVQAGITLAKLAEVLAKEGQFPPLEVPCPNRATVGGLLAAAYSGPLSLSYGLPRDWLIGIRVVNANGTVTKAGGKVVKNVTGYDMNKLYTGSLGTLGIIAEATFKVAPKPPVARTLAVSCSTLKEALAGASTLLQEYGRPSALIVANGEVAARLMPGAQSYLLLALFLGRDGVVSGRIDRSFLSLKGHGPQEMQELDYGERVGVWQRVVDLPWVGENVPDLGIRCSVVPLQVSGLLQALDSMDESSLSHGFVAEVGTGSVRSLGWGDVAPGVFAERIRSVTSLTKRFQGTWVIEKCPLSLKVTHDVWGPLPPGIEVMRRVKLALDPHGILNPGRFIGGL